MPDRQISIEPRALEDALREIFRRLDRLDGGSDTGVWPSFPEKILMGEGGLVIRPTQEVDPLAPPGELGLYLISTIPGTPPWPSSPVIAVVT